MSNKIDQHEIYKKLINDFPWLWEAPSKSILDEEYRKAFKLESADWFPYVNYYTLDALNELKPFLFSFSGINTGQGSIFLRAVWQLSKDTHASGVIVKHPKDTEIIVTYLDFITNNNKEVIEWFNRLNKFEYKLEEKAYGFKSLIPPKE